MRSFLAVVSLFAMCYWLGAGQPGAAPAKSGITFKVIGGEENGSQAILDARRSELLLKNDGKLSGHDWWLWGLTAIDYDLNGVPDFLVTIHGPAGNGVALRNTFKETGKLTF